MKKVAIFGGSFNPPTVAHRRIAEAIATKLDFDQIIVLPCGIRPDKATVSFTPTIHRAALVDMTFRGIAKTTVDLSDLERPAFTPTIDLEKRFATEGEIWHVVGADLIAGGAKGESAIQREWVNGSELWAKSGFIVVQRVGFEITASDLPPHHKLLTVDDVSNESSSEVRERIFNAQTFEHLVVPRVAEHIKRYGLYRGGTVAHTGIWLPPSAERELRIICEFDPNNDGARKTRTELYDEYSRAKDDQDMIVSLGGDGQLLRTIRKCWHQRTPFIGLNFGHVGFLLNPPETDLNQVMTVFHLPLLYIETTDKDGVIRQDVAFNDVWWERSSPSTAWMNITVNGIERIAKLEADGVLVATPQGSAAYARSMGSPPVPLNAQALIVVGNNVARPAWRFAILPMDAEIRVTNLSPEYRPIRAIVDGNTVVENIVSMTVRQSHIAAVELLFDPRLDIAGKIVAGQFPV